MIIDRSTSKKISATQFFGAVCIVFLHSNRYKYFPGTSEGLKVIIDWLGKWFPMTAMSIFFFLSGFLLFKDLNPDDPNRVDLSGWYKEKMKKRFKGLIIPYLLWNTIWMVFIMVIGVIPAVTSRLDSLLLYDGRFISILEGIFVYKYNLVFWYIAAIIMYSLLSPVFYILMKNRYTGMIFIFGVVMLSVMSSRFGRPAVWFLNEMGDFGLFFFLAGAFLAIHKSDLINRRYSKMMIAMGLAVSLTGALILCLCEKHGTSNEVISLICKTAGACGFWIFSDVFRRTGDAWIICEGFFVYATHRYIEQASNKLFEMVLPKNVPGMALVNIFGGAVLTLLIIAAAAWVLNRITPGIYAVLTGGRIGKGYG